ncbi:hypothetical protein [Streptomyces endocoffeicus]|uniref:hypothetical protein n=1 Tax=Streptomyces endocoffeicus TaxID=2898945 RepID=UPI001E52DEE5|nr:hypothetical protein [Streptomyces endocoffeicus]
MHLPPPGRRNGPQAGLWQWREIPQATAWSAPAWLDVDTTHASCTHAGTLALAGESTDHGSIGWVALAQGDDGSALRWLAVSQTSNPFHEVTLDDHLVTATSTSGYIWAFPREAPRQVKIIEDPAYPHR